MRKILVVGSRGMAGHVVYDYLCKTKKYLVFDLAREDASYCTDIADFTRLDEIFTEIQPDVVINCVGILVKASEDCPANAIFVNSYFTHALEDYFKDSTTKVIHLSTDCVFKGDKVGGGYLDTDIKDGVGFYAQSKAIGEIINAKDLTIRMSIIGPELKETGTGLFSWFMRQKGQVKGYSRVLWGGGTTLWLAQNIDKMLDYDLTGLYQLAPNYKISKFNLLKEIQEIWKIEYNEVIPNEDLTQDKTLINSSHPTFVPIMPSSYKEMLQDLKNYMDTK